MKKTITTLCLCLSIHTDMQADETVYLSPAGNDLGKGTAESPYYSLNKAIENRLTGKTADDTLFIRVMEGTYHMKTPFRIEQANSRPVVILADNPQAKPVFSGGITVGRWEKYGDKLYRAYVPEVVQYGTNFEQLYVNGTRAVLARTPNDGWYYVDGTSETQFTPGVRYADYAVQRIDFRPEDWKTIKGKQTDELSHLKFRFYHKWDITLQKATYVEPDSAFIYMQGKGMRPWNPIRKGSRYVMYDYMAALDMPGEWFLDRKEGYLYYMPRPEEQMETAECFIPLLSQLVTVKGSKRGVVKGVSFRNIVFSHTLHNMPEQGEDPFQAAAPVEAALSFDYAENISLYNCEVSHTGGYGIWFRQACHHNRIERCLLSDLGAGGIKIGEPYFRDDTTMTSSHNTVDNNIIVHAGRELPCGVGVAIFHSSDNRVTHNEIADLYYSGISVGWVWGYNQSPLLWTMHINRRGEVEYLQKELTNPAVRNLIAYNHIHHIGWGELSDMGAVYTLGESEGTVITHNVTHDVLTYDYGGWGLYTDEGSTGVTMTNNLVYRCKSGGFHQHYGKENCIENNIFAFGHYFQAQYTRPEEHLSFHFRHNIILQERGSTLSGAWKKGRTDMDYNLYWHLNGSPTFGKQSFEEWKKSKEPHSICADPLFKDPLNYDYSFASERNIRKIKFRPFDSSAAGVYGEASWKKQAQLSPEVLEAFEQRAKTILKN